jgi:hypothetical protein
MGKESVVEIGGHQYRYQYDEESGKTLYKGPVGTAPELGEAEFLKAVKQKQDRTYIATYQVGTKQNADGEWVIPTYQTVTIEAKDSAELADKLVRQSSSKPNRSLHKNLVSVTTQTEEERAKARVKKMKKERFKPLTKKMKSGDKSKFYWLDLKEEIKVGDDWWVQSWVKANSFREAAQLVEEFKEIEWDNIEKVTLEGERNRQVKRLSGARDKARRIYTDERARLSKDFVLSWEWSAFDI